MLSKEKSYRILFIGNSYTYFCGMAETLFPALAAASGYTVETEKITHGGWTLAQHIASGEVEAALDAAHFDFAVLQEQSLYPMTTPDSFFGSVRSLVETLRRSGVQPILYATWSRKDGSEALASKGVSFDEMTARLADAYTAIGRECGIPTAQVGRAFAAARERLPEVELYNADGSHPSPTGSYLAAATIASTLFGCRPAADFTGELDGETAAALCGIAAEIAEI